MFYYLDVNRQSPIAKRPSLGPAGSGWGSGWGESCTPATALLYLSIYIPSLSLPFTCLRPAVFSRLLDYRLDASTIDY